MTKKAGNNNHVSASTSASTNNHDLLSLIDTGKDKGFLTYDEINDAFPQDNFSVEEMDNLLETLGELGIDVVDSAEKARAEEEEAAEGKEAALPGGERVEDPGRIYMRE